MSNSQYKSMYHLIGQTVSTGGIQEVYSIDKNKSIMPYLKKINVCNLDINDTSISLGVAKLGEILGQDKHYLEYNLFLERADSTSHKPNSYAIDLDIGLNAGDVFFINTPSDKVAINIF